MTEKSLLTILIFFVAAASFWFFSLKKDVIETKEMLTDQPTRTRVVERTVASTPKTSQSSSVASIPLTNDEKKAAMQNELQAMQQRLADEQQKLAQQNESFNNLKALQTQQQEQPAAYASQIQQRNTEIQELVSSLQDYRAAEADLSRRAAAALREQSSAAAVMKDQMDENIRQQELLIRQTQEDLAYWQLNYNYAPEREANLERLNATLSDQQQRLADMRAQRLEISQSALVGTQNVNDQVAMSSSSGSDDRAQINEEIMSLREEIRRLQNQQNQTKQSVTSMNTQVSQAQTALRQQAETVRALQENIRQRQQELSSLQ
ncbi:hypothetical protein [Bdellovibrio sp. NC01]|uniref:hypothetical protein n=1 Tax=Bdellovibrio sp. NC01 TaxID=2220073 RepID=UPI00115A506F|nr:hypothetical protein [Bdellovibrio sp. NC01]